MTSDKLMDLDVTALVEAKGNRRTYDQASIVELAATMKVDGLLTPLLVRPRSGNLYEVAAGHRRLRAAKVNGWTTIKCVVRAMTDEEFLTAVTVENLQREDLHPLDEAMLFRDIITGNGSDVAGVAERVGRTTHHIYDRLKLLQLTAAAQKMFREGAFPLANAIILARLSPTDQTRALHHDADAMWRQARASYLLPMFAETEPLAPRTARELQSWVNRNVRVDLEDGDVLPNLFPETAERLESAKEVGLKVVHLTHMHQLLPSTKLDGQRTYTPATWKRAEKECEHVVLGVIVVGPGTGESFPACVAKKKCTVHWGKEIAARTKGTKAAAGKSATGESYYAEMERKQKVEEVTREAARAFYQTYLEQQFLSEMQKVVEEKVLPQTVIDLVASWEHLKARKGVAWTAEAVVRAMVRVRIDQQRGYHWAYRDVPPLAAALGVGVKAIEKAAKVQAAADATAAKEKPTVTDTATA